MKIERLLMKMIIGKDKDIEDISILSTNIIIQDINFIKNCFNFYKIDENIINMICCILSLLIYNYKNSEMVYNLCKEINISEYTIDECENGIVFGIFYIKNVGIFLIFKGSSSINDYLTDANILLVKNEKINGNIHQGFNKMMFDDHVYEKICKKIEDFKRKFFDENIYVSGHSLGGALSILFSSLYKKCTNISFGSPRVGDNTFSKNLNGIRIVNGTDIVTMIPFKPWYSHIEKIFKMKTKSFKFFSIKDHQIENYYFNLKKIIENSIK